MIVFTAQLAVGETSEPNKYVLVAQDTGQFNLLKVQQEPEPASSGFFN